jgi:hypothetical protein
VLFASFVVNAFFSAALAAVVRALILQPRVIETASKLVHTFDYG